MHVFENCWKKGVLCIYVYVVAEKRSSEHTPPGWSGLLASGLLPSIEGKRHCLSCQASEFQLHFLPMTSCVALGKCLIFLDLICKVKGLYYLILEAFSDLKIL